MRAQRFVASLSFMPSLAWAARPLASGAPFAVIARRCHSSVKVGCPSCGGQRTGGGGSCRLLAGLVTGSDAFLTTTGVGVFGSGFNSQTARSAQLAAVGAHRKSGWAVVNLCTAKLLSAGRTRTEVLSRSGLTGKHKHQSPVRQSRAPASVGVESRAARSSRKGWPAAVGATPAPNPSVKGTSCGKPQAAPYLER